MKSRLAAVGLMLVACGTQAQPIYRCGGTVYSQTPCPGGKVLESSDPRSAAQRAEAVRLAAEERRRAAMLERERRAQQAGIKPARASGFNGRPPPAEAAAAPAKLTKPSRGATKAGVSPAKTTELGGQPTTGATAAPAKDAKASRAAVTKMGAP